MRFPSFIDGSYLSQSPLADAERTINLYPEQMEVAGAKNRFALYPTPGFQSRASVSQVGSRAAFTGNGRTHFVIGSGVYEHLTTAVTTLRGSVTQDNNPAGISFNGIAGNQLLVNSGGGAAYLNLSTNVLTAIPNLTATMCGMIDGFGIALDATNSKYRISALNDFSSWDPTQFLGRSLAPDPWKAMIVADKIGVREIWLIGEVTGEVHYDTGGFPFPFAPIPGALFKWGIVAPFSLAAAGPQIMWLSQTAEGDGIVVGARGYTPSPVSTKALETAISGYKRTAKITDAEAFSYQQEGHTFYVLTFPSVPATWCYDTTTQKWHERGKWNPAMSRFDAWSPRVHTSAFGLHLVGDRSTGTIATMDVTFGTELDGTAIRRMRQSPGLSDEYKKVLYRRFQLYLETGLGTATGQGTTPQVMLRTSNDGGKTFGSERWATAGAMGQYRQRVKWGRLGVSRDRVFQVTMTDPIPWRIVDAWLNNDTPAQAVA